MTQLRTSPMTVADMVRALFEPDGARFVPTDLARGPWSKDALHGGPPAALLATTLERIPSPLPMQIVRLSVDLLRPVPVAPLAVRTRITRPGKKVQIVEASLLAGDVEVARATALRIRTADLPLPSLARPAQPPGPEAGTPSMPPWSPLIDWEGFHNGGVEHRFVAGSFERPGPATDWIRLAVPLVAGEDTSPLARVSVVADFGNGVSWVLSRVDGWQFINPDLTLYLHRLPAGEWVCLESTTAVEGHGIGVAESRLWDERGMLGRSLQSLLIERS